MSGIGAARLDHIGVMVADIDAVVEWYTRSLGMQVHDRWENDEIGMKWAHLSLGELTIEFVQRPGLDPAAPSAAGYHHLALAVDDAAEATRALDAAGAHVVFEPSYFERHDMDWAFVQDPFGNTIEVVSYRSP